MEYSVPIPRRLSQYTLVVLITGIADLFVSVALFVSYVNWSTITTLYAFLILFQIFHTFSWALCINIGYGTISISYIALGLVIYILAGFLDLVSLLWRFITWLECTNSSCDSDIIQFVRIEFFLILLLFIIDSISFFSILMTIGTTQSYVSKVRGDAILAVGSNSLALVLYKPPRPAYMLRRIVSFIWYIEFWVVIFILAMIILGFGINSNLNYLLIFLIPHYYNWTLSLMVAGTPGLFPSDAIQDPDYIFAVAAILGATFIVDIVGISYGFYQMQPCFQDFSSCNSVQAVLSLIVLIVYVILSIFSITQALSCSVIQYELEKHYGKNQAHINTLEKKEKQMALADESRLEAEKKLASSGAYTYEKKIL
jgi:hypothetical protein